MIKNKVLQTLTDYNMITDANRITVALSGGADSVCLLHILLQLKDKLGITLYAAHLNHCIRGEEADRDEAFVKSVCEKWNIPLFCERTDVPLFAQKEKLSLELAARQIRYEFLERVRGNGVIATAHNADDNLETIIFNLTRGTALKGLCGIPAVRDKIVRPLLFCTRQQIEEYCSENNLHFVTDSTNLSDDYTRNKIRHNVVPILKTLNPAIEDAVARTAALLSTDNSFIEQTVNAELDKRFDNSGKLCLKDFDKLHRSVATRLLKSFCEKIGLRNVGYSHIEQLYYVALNGGECCLPEKMLVSSNKILKIKENIPTDFNFKVEISSCETENFKNNKKINNLLLKNYLDCDKIVGKLSIRTRKTGDSVRLKNKSGTKSLKKLYTEYKIPVDKREVWPVISDDCGVVWIHKIGVADRCATDENSVNILKINVVGGFGDNNDNV